MFTFVLPLLSHRCVCAPLRFSYRKNLVVVGVEKKIMVWLKNSLFTTQMDGSVPRSPYKNIQFCRHESSWKYPKMSLKILSGVTQTAVTHLAVLLASI